MDVSLNNNSIIDAMTDVLSCSYIGIGVLVGWVIENCVNWASTVASSKSFFAVVNCVVVSDNDFHVSILG